MSPDDATASKAQRSPGAELAAHVLDLHSTRRIGAAEQVLLDGVSASFARGVATAVFGPSGSGKTTLHNVLAGLEAQTSGKVTVGDRELTGMRERDLTRLRRSRIGMVPERADLVATLSAGENLLLPMTLAGQRPARAWFDAVVQAAGLQGLLNHAPVDLTPVQQQLVAAARAVLPRPVVVLADEPTGRLTPDEGDTVLRLLMWARDEAGLCVIWFTHDPSVAAVADRVLMLSTGRIVADLHHPTLISMLAKLAELDASRRARIAG